MVYIATAVPSLVGPRRGFGPGLSLASSPAIGASVMMKPMIVPTAQFRRRVAGERPKPFEPRRRSASERRATSDRAVRALACALSRRHHGCGLAIRPSGSIADGARAASSPPPVSTRAASRVRIAFARNGDRSPKTMERRALVDHRDHGGEIRTVGTTIAE